MDPDAVATPLAGGRTGEGLNGVLRRSIATEAHRVGAQRGAGHQIDDGAALLGQNEDVRGASGERRPASTSTPCSEPLFLQVEQRAVAIVVGIVDQDVQTAPSSSTAVGDQSIAVFELAHIAGHRDGIATHGLGSRRQSPPGRSSCGHRPRRWRRPCPKPEQGPGPPACPTRSRWQPGRPGHRCSATPPATGIRGRPARTHPCARPGAQVPTVGEHV